MVRKKDTLRTVADLLLWEPLLADGQRAALLSVPCPEKVLGVRVPQTLDALSLEELARLWEIKTTRDLFVIGAEVLLKKGEREVLKAPVLPLLGFANMVSRELQRIGDLWQTIPSTHTAEELQAGCQRLQFGVFGIADWYARRMGIHNHDEAFATPWQRVFLCLRNDSEEAQYRKRLNDIILKQHKK